MAVYTLAKYLTAIKNEQTLFKTRHKKQVTNQINPKFIHRISQFQKIFIVLGVSLGKNLETL